MRWDRLRPSDPLAADLAKLLLNAILGHRFEWHNVVDLGKMTYSNECGVIAVGPPKPPTWFATGKEITLGGGRGMGRGTRSGTDDTESS